MYINDGWNSGRSNAGSVLGVLVVSSEPCPSKGVWRELCDEVVCWPAIGGTLLAVAIVGVPVIRSEGKLGKTLGKFSTEVSSVAQLGLLSCMLTHVHLPFWSRLCGHLWGCAGVMAAVWFRLSGEERMEVARLLTRHHESILGLKQMARPLPTRDSGKLRSSWHTWSMCYLSPPLGLSFHRSLVLWLLATLRFWYVSHELRSISRCWGLAAQTGLIEFIWKLLPNVHSVSKSRSPSPAEVKRVKVDALLTCASLPWCYVMLFSCVVIPVATTTIVWHIILPDACRSCAVLALAGFTPAE